MKYSKDKALSQQLIRGVSGTAGLSAINIALTLIIGIVIARSLGPENYGIYAFVLSVVTLLGLPIKAGLPVLVVRETALNQLAAHWGLLHGLLRIVNLFVVAFSLVISLMVIAVLKWTPLGSQSEWKEALLWAVWLLPLLAFGNIRGATLRGLRKAVAGQIPEQLVRPGIQLVLLTALFISGISLTVERAVQLNVVSALIAFLIGACLLWMFLPKQVRKAEPSYEFGVWWASLIPLSLIAGMKLIDSQLIVLLLGTISSAENVGFYRVALQGATLVTFGLTAINLVLSPHVARLYREGDMVSLQRLITLATRAAFMIAFPIAALLSIFAEPLIALVFGAEYTDAAMSLVILCLGQLFSVGAGSVGVILNMAGHEREAMKAICAALLVSVTLAVMLVPSMGSTGAAIAATCSLVVWNSLMVLAVHRHIGVKAFIMTQRKVGRR